MKKRNIISALALTVIIGVGATAYAASNDNTSKTNDSTQRLGLGRITSMRGYDYITSILKNKLGLSDEEITSAGNSGKSIYDLAKEKGMSDEQLKAALLEERTKAIDEAINKGALSKEDGEALKEKLMANIENCNGNFRQGQCLSGGMGQGNGQGQGRGRGQGQGRGMIGRGQGGFNQVSPNNGNGK